MSHYREKRNVKTIQNTEEKGVKNTISSFILDDLCQEVTES